VGPDHEVHAIRNMLQTFAPEGCALVLTDTYDHENCVKNIIGGELADLVRSFPGLVGVRPDSGYPVQVAADTTEWLIDAFGCEVNSKGFKVLPAFVRAAAGREPWTGLSEGAGHR
jgi:nicotinamide phosphoribosyltransferase